MRDAMGMVYDALRGEVVLFGGTLFPTVYNDTWTWDGSNWQRESPPASPPARAYEGLAYDEVRGNVVLFGGGDNTPTVFNDTWEWEGTTWTQVFPYADRLNYAVAGTPNRLEYDQGFFVKNGDGAADVKPIAHLYKSQVYQLAEHLDVPAEIRRRPPTTDTWSLAQTQDEFYFSLPYDRMDLCLYGLANGIAVDAVGRAAGLTVDQVERVWRDIASKRRATRHLHEAPLLVDGVLPTD